MNGAREQSILRTAVASALSPSIWARIVRVVLIFALVFWCTLRLEYKVAYAADWEKESIIGIDIEPTSGSISDYQGYLEFKALATWVEFDKDGEIKKIHEGNKRADVTDMMDWSVSGEGASIDGNGVLTASGTVNGTVDVYCTISGKNWKYLNPEYFENQEFSVGPFSVELSNQVWHTVYSYSNDANGYSSEEGVIDGGSYYVGGIGDWTNPGYSFEGWSTSSDGKVQYQEGDTIDGIDADVELYAQWKAKESYTLTYDANGGSGEMGTASGTEDDELYVEGCGFTPPKDKEFSHWKTKKDDSGDAYYEGGSIWLSGNTTLYAQWADAGEPAAEGPFTVTYDANGGSGDMGSAETEEDGKYTFAENGFDAPENKEFKGWNTSEDGSGKDYEAGTEYTLTENTKVYAQWKDASDTPEPQDSYAYVEGIEIVQEDGTSFDREGSTALVKLPITSQTTYNFRAKVTVILDSNEPENATQFTVTPTAGLREQAAEHGADLPDLVWSVTMLSTDDGSDQGGTEGDAEGGDGEGTGGTTDGEGTGGTTGGDATTPGAGESTPAGQGSATIDSATGTLTITPGVKAQVICSSEKGFGWPTSSEPVLVADDGVIVDTTQASEDPDAEYVLSYDANGGSGEMESVTLHTGESTTVAECTFTPPAPGSSGTVPGDNSGSGTGTGDENGAGTGTGDNGGTEGGTEGGAGTGGNETDNALGTNAEDDPEPAAGDNPAGGTEPAGTGDSGDPTGGDSPEGTAGDTSGDVTPKPFKFAKWNTAADGSGVSYMPGDPITLTADTVLYAQWSTGSGEEIEGDFTLTYDANGGKGTMEPVTSTDGEPIEVADCTFESPTGRSFSGWCTSVDGLGAMYQPGKSIQLKGNTTLYAQWGRGNEFGCEIDYTPVEMGEWALLTGIAYGTGDSSFGFLWETSKDGGSTWDFVTGDESYINDESPQTLRVKTTSSTLGMLVRATVQTSDDRSAVSDPITMVEGNADLIISYEPVHYGETALFQLTSKLKNAKYQWQVSHDNQNSWENVDGATGMTLAVPTIEGNLGSFYRVIATVKDKEKQERSNALMLTATTDTPGDDDPQKDEGDGGDDPDADDGDDEGDDDEDEEGGYIPIPIDDDDDDGDDEGGDIEEPLPTPSPEPTPAPVPQTPPNAEPITFVTPDYPHYDPDKTAVVIDPEVQEKIKESEVVTKDEQEARTPGARWRKLDVIPTPEEVQEILDSNPLAPLVLPITLALLACGCVERLLMFRRQTTPGITHFA